MLTNWSTNNTLDLPIEIIKNIWRLKMIESFILIGGLVLFSSTVTYDLNKQLVAAQKVNAADNIDRGFYQDIKK